MDIGAEDIDSWHEARGFKSPTGVHNGYNDVIRRDGAREKGRPDSEAGAHCKGHNSDSLGVCLVGGKDGFNFTSAQMDELNNYIAEKKLLYPSITEVSGHNEYSDKPCPQFDVKEWLK